MVGSEDLRALFATVYDSPNDVDAKLVLADALQELGDPRGEFIALQLRPRTKRVELRLAKLLERHRAEFLGRFGAVFRPDHQAWEHGFLVGGWATLDGSTVDEPAWAMVRHLTLLGPGGYPPLELTGPHTRSLIELEHVGLEALQVVHRSPRPLSLHALAVDGPDEPGDWPEWSFEALRTFPACPSLTRLGLRFWRFDPDRLGWLWSAPVLARLRVLELSMPRALVNVTQVVDALRQRADGPQAIVLRGRTLEVKVKSSADWSVLNIRVRTSVVAAALTDAATMLELMPPDALTRLEIASEVPISASALARLKRVVRRFHRLEAMTWPEK